MNTENKGLQIRSNTHIARLLTTEGSIVGSLVGALIMTLVGNGCTKMGLGNWVQQMVTGAILVAAVALDQLRHRLST